MVVSWCIVREMALPVKASMRYVSEVEECSIYDYPCFWQTTNKSEGFLLTHLNFQVGYTGHFRRNPPYFGRRLNYIEIT